MDLPPVPPRPLSSYGMGREDSLGRPPLPPLPPQLANEFAHQSYPAPRPQRVGNAANDMAQRLENQLPPSFPFAMPSYGGPSASPYTSQPPPPQQHYGSPSPYAAPYGGSHSPALPQQPPPLWSGGPPPPAPPQQPQWQSQGLQSPVGPGGWASPAPPPSWPSGPPPNAFSGTSSFSSLSSSFADLSFGAPSPQQQPPPQPQRRDPTPEKGPPAVVAPLPTIASLTSVAASVSTSSDPSGKIKWAKDVLALVDRTVPAAKTKGDAGSQITDPELVRLTDMAIQHILNISGNASAGQGTLPSFVAEALYLRGNLSSTGSFPAYLPRDPRMAFKDFETSAKGGFNPAWFKLGRDYETVGDPARAKDCFERGRALQETSCLYRLGMANLLGQLNIQKNPQEGLHLLRRAADQADLDVPQPSYVYGMLLLGEFEQVEVPIPLIMSVLPPASAQNPDPRQSEARRRIERAAYFAFAPAQYKLGWAYEYAKLGCAFDPLLSVQYYSLASQQGETEADMALSKWFLCGSEGAFEKDEVLAVTFAEKAAKKGLPSAEFAMGYYYEVGIGGPKDLVAAKKWYQRAAAHKNPEAVQRLQALSQPAPEALSRAEHDKLTSNTLVRKRTQAKDYSMANGRGSGGRGTGSEISEAKKMAAAARREAAAAPIASDGLPMPSLPASVNTSPLPSPPASDPRPLPGRYPSPTRQDVSSGSGGRPLPPGQQPLPGGRFGRKDDSGSGGYGRGAGRFAARPSDDRRDSDASASGGMSLPSAGAGRRPNQEQGAGRRQENPNPGRQSYALSDGGPKIGSPPKQAPAPAPAPVSAPAPKKQPQQAQAHSSHPPKKGPETFAEMGFHSAPVQDKDCIIM